MTSDLDLGKKFDKAIFPGSQGGPLEHVIAAKAVAFGEALKPEIKTYSSQVIANAQALAAQLQTRGFKVVSDGTDNHLVLVDLRSIGMTGKQADALVSMVNITANKNTVPFDPESPFVTSGLRLGSPAMTTRGLAVEEFKEIANIIADRLLSPEDSVVETDCRNRVAVLCERFPLYPHLHSTEAVFS
jgi:glycine hydroxymethyltransferase